MTQPSMHRQGQYTPGEWYRPVIAIPWSAGRRAGLFAPFWHAYDRAIEEAGGTPLWLPPVADLAVFAPLWAWIDGILLPGGPDVHPQCYNEEPRPLLGTVDEEADRFELWLAREALQRNVPTLGVNRGLQVLNVACQGTLFQDLGDQLGTALPHITVGLPREAHTHPVSIVPGTGLADLLGPEPAYVNSWHHQGVKDLGDDVVIAAMAPDDVVEAIEAPGKRFAVAVQWAVEALALAGDRRMSTLFRGFVAAASTYGTLRQRRLLLARDALERWESMWLRDLVAYTQGRERLFGEEPLGDLEALELRQQLPVLKGRVQAIVEALGLADPTSLPGRL